ncbi:MAG: GNAT family N-acetyltransferase [Caldilineaceae bacterium SB0675_bin_29]|uniref:GNAT family N-acetyltransferase n=1 Tax=Caldilineaceae bacterium SB0675_bin_29 TaxID=2605266 RepID=A0A6B1G0N1_9CHLR|nr:GNAT family N-acetyltransferase [Caldilineaceae bacterium SB0675_bin_29]
MDNQGNSRLLFLPVTAERLPDLEEFSNCHGKFRYCSCMRWRMTSSAFRRSTKEKRVAALEELVRAGTPVGILAYSGTTPVGWCSVAPRESYAALERSRVLPRVDDAPVWSVVCLFVDRRFRRQGLTGRLLQAAVDYARGQGAPAVEGYPVAPDAPSYTYMGTPETYRRAGFVDVTPVGQKRMVMRYNLHS